MKTPESATDREQAPAGADSHAHHRRWQAWGLTLLILLIAAATFAVTGLLVSIFARRQEAREPFVRLMEVNEVSTDPAPWGINWPYQYETYLRTVDTEETEYGGSSAMPASKLESDPWLKRLYAGYAFSLDYREARGHAYMLHDQTVTERVTKRSQSGACLHCHASVIPTYRRIGMERAGEQPTAETLGKAFDLPAVMAGFRHLSTKPYGEVLEEVRQTPDGTPAKPADAAASPASGRDAPDAPRETDRESSESENTPDEVAAADTTTGPHLGDAHPVSCIDCHDPETMQIRVTRPGFLEGIARLASSEATVPHLPSIERWRSQDSDQPYDPNALASRQEMRTFVCAQCHVEYYCASKMTLTFPWGKGLKAEQIEQFWEETKFDDGSAFYDYQHGETGAPVFKAQHPEFELWSQGIHARSGVSCADCHMPYERQGAMKVSSHEVQSPLLTLNRSCQTCHNVSEDELRARVETIQGRTRGMLDRAAVAMTEMLDAILAAQAAGVDEAKLQPIFALQRQAMWRLDYISSENSLGFHADQEAMRLLGESIDYSRQAQAAALAARAPETPEIETDGEPIQGVTPTAKAPLPDRSTP
jgi:nitrite reductase (cytochrome c-552)